MAGTPIDPKKTALLLLDIQYAILRRLPEDRQQPLLDAAKLALDTVRSSGGHVAYIRVALNESELAGIPDHNTALAAIRGNEQMKQIFHPDHPATAIHDSVKPQEGDMQHRKIRYGSFMRGPSNEMLDDFKARGIDTVVLGGIVTSGAVLSAVRQLADLDYRLVVVEDMCMDPKPEVHQMLMEHVFPNQATVIKSAELKGLFA